MYAPINFLEIISDYYKHMREDLKPIPFIITLIVIPFILSFLFILTIKDEKRFYGSLINVSAILIPLLLNLLMIVYYSLERAESKQRKKIDYLEHINSTISMTTLIAIFILILSLILSNLDFSQEGTIADFLKTLNLNPNLISIVLKFLLFYSVGFLITNVIISLVRVYRLIRYEIKEKSDPI